MIQRDFNKPTLILSGFATPSKQQPDILKAKNIIFKSILILSNYRNYIIFKKTLKSKCINCDQSYSLPAKCTKITEGQKLADFIHAMVEELKLSCEGKAEPTK